MKVKSDSVEISMLQTNFTQITLENLIDVEAVTEACEGFKKKLSSFPAKEAMEEAIRYLMWSVSYQREESIRIQQQRAAQEFQKVKKELEGE